MTIKCSVYIAASVDGFIARSDGDIDWLHHPDYSKTPMKGLNFEEFIATVDALVMGRNTFEKILSFNQWPYPIPVIVLTGKAITIPKKLHDKVRVLSLTPEQLVSTLEQQGYRHLYIDGGNTTQRFLQAGLINEITITQIPILLGSGISLFGSFGMEIPLQFMDAAPSDNGFVQIRYNIGNKT